jgi:hypothetical protein
MEDRDEAGIGGVAAQGGKRRDRLRDRQLDQNWLDGQDFCRQIEKEEPQPQVAVALGLSTMKREPSNPSV